MIQEQCKDRNGLEGQRWNALGQYAHSRQEVAENEQLKIAFFFEIVEKADDLQIDDEWEKHVNFPLKGEIEQDIGSGHKDQGAMHSRLEINFFPDDKKFIGLYESSIAG